MTPVLLVLAAACGGGGASQRITTPPAGTPAVGAQLTPGATPGTPAATTPAADDYPPLSTTFVDSLDISTARTHAQTAWAGPLVPWDVGQGAFEITVPKNWASEKQDNQDFIQLAYRDNTGVFANLAIQCKTGIAIEDLILEDRNFIFAVQIGYRVQTPRTTVIAGREFREVRWTGGLAPLLTDNVTFYLPTPHCVWRLQFGVYHGLRIKDYRSTIEDIVASFVPKAP